MYKYVSNATVKKFHGFCADKLNQVKQDIWNEYEIKSNFHLVGSGAKNLVTQNGNAPFDLDYNFEILNYDIAHLQLSPNELKKFVMDTLNKNIKQYGLSFKNCKDSTSVITSRLIYDGKLEASFDIAILARNKQGTFCRLVHDKNPSNERYQWLEIPDSKDVNKKTAQLKQHGWWDNIRETYLNKKNMYLKRNDYTHPSFVVFTETINEVYSEACK